MSLTLSSMYRYPSSSMRPTSPVRSQPPGVIASLVASGMFQYPAIT